MQIDSSPSTPSAAVARGAKAHTRAPRAPRPPQSLDACKADRDFVMSFARGLVTLGGLADRERAPTIAELSVAVQLPRAAVRRLLHTLEVLGYVAVEDGRWAPTARSLAVGHAFLSGTPLGRGSARLAARLAGELSCVSMVTVEDGDEVLLIGTAGLRDSFPPKTVLPAVGARAPMFCSASGLLFMSAWTEAQLRDFLGRAPFSRYTQRTPTDAADLLARIEQAREQRYALCDRTFTPSHRSLAVPVLDGNGRIAAAVVAVTDAERWSVAQLTSEVLPRVSAAARELSAQLR